MKTRVLVRGAMLGAALLSTVSPAAAGVLRLTPLLGLTYPESRRSYGVQMGLGFFLPISIEGDLFKVKAEEAFPDSVFLSGGIRAQAPLPTVAPYVAAGLGLLREDRGIETDTYFTSNIGGGADIRLADHVGLQGEYRIFKVTGHADPSTFKRISIGLSLKF